jgi:hypothetical protein
MHGHKEHIQKMYNANCSAHFHYCSDKDEIIHETGLSLVFVFQVYLTVLFQLHGLYSTEWDEYCNDEVE